MRISDAVEYNNSKNNDNNSTVVLALLTIALLGSHPHFIDRS